MKNDIKTREDIKLVVNSFYNKVKQDEKLMPYFTGLDWNQHLPVMYKFWYTMILKSDDYIGNPFEKHVKLTGLQGMHFDHWLGLFNAAVDENFKGVKAEGMKVRATQIATIFRGKLTDN